MIARLRTLWDRVFTGLAGLSVVLMAGALAILLGPILYRGAQAVFFTGTVEFDRMQKRLFGRGDTGRLEREVRGVEAARQRAYDALEAYRSGLTKEDLRRPVEGLSASEKDVLIHLYHENLWKKLGRVTVGEALAEVELLMHDLYGPRPGQPTAGLDEKDLFGATRWDRARDLRQRLRTVRGRRLGEGAEKLEAVSMPRRRLFAGELDRLFDLMGDDEYFASTLKPRFTVYWQYFIDGSSGADRFFGGVWPEVVGTLLLTVLSMVFAVPVGIVAAAYLVECSGDSLFVRVIRTCINTLAGVPSIVFGLFGLAFFLLWLPRHAAWTGLSSHRNIFAGAMTLGVLALPIIIRASEEAIRSVPQTYREASLALGAGGFRTFVTVTLPAALPGILTGIILSMSRAAGETAPILFTAAVPYRKGIPGIEGVFTEDTTALSYSAWHMAMENPDAKYVPHKQYGMTMTLILLVLLLNVGAITLRWRVSRKLRGQ